MNLTRGNLVGAPDRIADDVGVGLELERLGRPRSGDLGPSALHDKMAFGRRDIDMASLELLAIDGKTGRQRTRRSCRTQGTEPICN
jgi:hypothetical protein